MKLLILFITLVMGINAISKPPNTYLPTIPCIKIKQFRMWYDIPTEMNNLINNISPDDFIDIKFVNKFNTYINVFVIYKSYR